MVLFDLLVMLAARLTLATILCNLMWVDKEKHALLLHVTEARGKEELIVGTV